MQLGFTNALTVFSFYQTDHSWLIIKAAIDPEEISHDLWQLASHTLPKFSVEREKSTCKDQDTPATAGALSKKGIRAL